MPVSPKLTISIKDGGIGAISVPLDTVAVIGTAAAGTSGSVTYTTDPDAVKSTYTGGPLVEAANSILAESDAAVLLVRAATTTPSTGSAVTTARVGSSLGTLQLSGTPYNAYEGVVEITTTTANIASGNGAFIWSLDGGDTYSAPTAIPTAGTFAVPNAGFNLIFGGTTKSFDDGDVFTFTTTAPAYSTTALSNAFDILEASGSAYPFRFVYATGEAANAAASAAAAAVLKTKLDARANNNLYSWGIIQGAKSSAESDNTLAVAFENFASERVAVAAGDVEWVSPLYGRLNKRPAALAVAVEAARRPIYEDLGKVKTGPIKRVTKLYRDERLSPGLDGARFVTCKTINGLNGFYITQGNMMAAAGSDYDLIQYRQIVDRACEVTYAGMARYLNDNLRTNADGTIDARDAAAIDSDLLGRLEQTLLNPGFVSAIEAKVNRTNNLQTTRTLRCKVRIQPLGYAKDIQVEIGLTSQL